MRPPPAFTRFEDWPERLAALVEARRHAPFAWGLHDCCLFAADAVLACCGRDPAAPWRGRYADEAGAERVLAAGGGVKGVAAAGLAAIGAPACPPRLAQRGDLALVRLGNMHLMAVVLGEDVAAPGFDGLAFLPAGAMLRAWAT